MFNVFRAVIGAEYSDPNARSADDDEMVGITQASRLTIHKSSRVTEQTQTSPTFGLSEIALIRGDEHGSGMMQGHRMVEGVE